MATRSANPRPAKAESAISASFWWGFVLLAVALVVLLALASYSAEDSEYLQELYPQNSGRIAFNWMGKPGAVIAYGLGTMLFGRWAAFGIAAVIGIWGWTLLRRLHWKRPLILTAAFLGATVWLSTVLGLFGRIGDVDAREIFHHEGLLGSEIANALVNFLNVPGAVLIMALVLILGLAATFAGFAGRFERGVNTAIDRAAQVKLPAVTVPKLRWFQKRVKPGKVEERDPEQEPVAAILPKETNGSHGKAPIEIIKPAARKEKAPDSAQLAMQIEDRSGYVFPPVDLFNPPKPGQDTGMTPDALQRASELLEKTLATFGVQAKVVRVNPGPVITRFDLEPAPGVKVSRIEALADDIALALRARGLRILAPIPGMAAVGVEIANPKATTVTFREVIESPSYQTAPSKLQIALGRTVQGDIFVTDLAALPHLLIAGTTGSGKSVCVNTIIASILLRTTPEEVQFVMIDPKKLELAAYNELRNHHVTHRPDLSEYVITKPDEAVKVLRSCLIEMEHRYDLLAERGARHIREYNEMVRENPGENDERELPFIVVVIDELADLMVTAQREVEEPIARLAQLARAVGIHLIVATQRPSVDVITGVIKANFPARIAFRVAMKVDSRTILDTNGSESLLGKGDSLYLPAGSSRLHRIHGPYVGEVEVQEVCDFWREQAKAIYNEDILKPPKDETAAGFEGEGGEAGEAVDDDLYQDAVRVVCEAGRASTSTLQRRLRVGYGRAARLIDLMEKDGIVGPPDGSKPREVLKKKEWMREFDESMK